MGNFGYIFGYTIFISFCIGVLTGALLQHICTKKKF